MAATDASSDERRWRFTLELKVVGGISSQDEPAIRWTLTGGPSSKADARDTFQHIWMLGVWDDLMAAVDRIPAAEYDAGHSGEARIYSDGTYEIHGFDKHPVLVIDLEMKTRPFDGPDVLTYEHRGELDQDELKDRLNELGATGGFYGFHRARRRIAGRMEVGDTGEVRVFADGTFEFDL